MTLSSLVCRTCLGIISENKTGYSIEDANGLVRNVENIREMIQFCFPELNTYISVKPSICDTCLNLLISSYNFKIRCMKVESVIQNYIQTNNIMEGTCVNLNNVVRLQIYEALKQKNWPMDLIKEYVSKVDACLAKTRPPVLNCLKNSNNNNTSSNTPDICIDITDSDDETPRVSAPPVTQENYLSTLNLINCNTLREEVSLVQSAQEQYNSRQRTRHFVKSVGSKLRQIRMPNVSCRTVEEINANSDDPEEVLIMNFVDNDDLLRNTDSHLKEAYIGDKLNLENRMPMKRKLTPEEAVDEILSKRRKLVVKINPNLPYLHKNKSLSVMLDKSPTFKCKFCKYSCLTMDVLNLHHNRFHKTCKLCDYRCSTKPVLDRHLNQEHAEKVKSILESHGNDPSFPCYCCKYVAISKEDLRDHRSRKHIIYNHLVFKCPVAGCDVEYSDHYLIIRHMENTHDSAKKRECPLCNHISSQLADVKPHIRTHSLFSVTCTFCGLRFRSNAVLKMHMEEKHSVPIREHQSGMIYDFSGDHLNLTTNKDGIVMLGQTSAQPDRNCDKRAGSDICSWENPSLMEMLCSSSLHVTPEREDDCVLVDENDQDCMIVESNNEPIVVDDDFSFHDWILQGQPPNAKSSDVITIEDDDDSISTVKTSDKNTEGKTTINASEDGVNDKTNTAARGLEESLNVTVEKIVEEASKLEKQSQNNKSSAELESTIPSQESEVVQETTSLETQEKSTTPLQNSEVVEETALETQQKSMNPSQESEETASLETQPKSTTPLQDSEVVEETALETQQKSMNPSQKPEETASLETQEKSTTILQESEVVEETASETQQKNMNPSQESEVLEETISLETQQNIENPVNNPQANEVNSLQEVEQVAKEPVSITNEDDKPPKEMQEESTTGTLKVTSLQELLQPQNFEEPLNSYKDNSEDTLELLEEDCTTNKSNDQSEMVVESTIESKEVTSSQDSDRSTVNVESEQNMEDPLITPSNNQDNNETQESEKVQSELKEVTSSHEKSSGNTESQLNIEETLMSLNPGESSTNENIQQSEISEERQLSAVDLKEVSSSQTLFQLSCSDEPFSESQLNLEETLQRLEGNSSQKKNVSSSLELQNQLEEQIFSSNNTSQQVEEIESIVESINVTSSENLTVFNTQAELMNTSNCQNVENSNINALELIQPSETSTFPETDEELLSEITNALLNMDETGSDTDFGLTDNSCEVSSSNLLDDISQTTEDIDKFGSF